MKKIIAILISPILFAVLFAAHGMAERDGNRYYTDQQYRLAKKAYSSTVEKYGETLENWPAKDKAHACKQMSQGVFYQRTAMETADMLNKQKYQKQLKELEGYSRLLECQ